jgi:signal transduction histidine kinase
MPSQVSMLALAAQNVLRPTSGGLEQTPSAVGCAARTSSREVEMKPADAAPNSAFGEFVASIAHEVTEPLSAMAMNGETSLRWLDRSEPNVAKARELLQRIVADARRAAEIISQARTMADGGTSAAVAVAPPGYRGIDGGPAL